jgi:DNA-directed RNA polymerase subunit RPC12/RpoP
MSASGGTHTVAFLGSIGSALALFMAVAAPCCLPIFAAFAGAVGLTALGLSEEFVLYAVQGFALLAMVGLVFSVSRHRQFGPLILGAIATLALFFSFHARFSALLVYLSLGGLCIASVWKYLLSRKRRGDGAGVILQSVIKCPKCGHRAEETMPTNACLFFYECARCGATLKPKSGDCCVFCSYGFVPCPPIQTGAACCA